MITYVGERSKRGIPLQASEKNRTGWESQVNEKGGSDLRLPYSGKGKRGHKELKRKRVTDE